MQIRRFYGRNNRHQLSPPNRYDLERLSKGQARGNRRDSDAGGRVAVTIWLRTAINGEQTKGCHCHREEQSDEAISIS